MTGDHRPSYWLDLYGDATIAWVPPVTNYLYNENVSKRGINDRSFRWEEVEIDLTAVQSGAILDFITPDYYVLQITPDLGWHDTIAMLGESSDSTIHNPHLKNLGPFSITNGTLTHGSDNSALVTLTEEQMSSAVIDKYAKYVWRAVPWAQGNPGAGGLPAAFEWIASSDQVKFAVDPIQKETKKNTQVISGTKGPRISITVESENNPTVFIEQTSATWKVLFTIDRPHVKFKIVASDEGGSAIINYTVDMNFDMASQYSGHVWNAFDGFAMIASLERLPSETNANLKARIVDSFVNKGGTHYRGLINGVNRELGLQRKDSAITVNRYVNSSNTIIEPFVLIESTHSRLSVYATSFTIHDEIKKIDSYSNTVTTAKRIHEIVSIRTSNNQLIDSKAYRVSAKLGQVSENTIDVDPEYSGLIYITYQYKEDILYSQYPTIGDVVVRIGQLTNQTDDIFLVATLDGTMSGSEPSKYLYKTYDTISGTNRVSIGWSPIGVFAISDEEYKWSFANADSSFFDSEFYGFVLELKSKTNIEWGFIVADKDYWDAVDAEWYGRDSLPIALDVSLSRYVTAIAINNRSPRFDPYEAFRMGYYFDSTLIKNIGFPQLAFRSGVGYKKDCTVGVYTTNVSSQDTKINFNPNTVNNKDTFSYSNVDRVRIDI